MSGSCRLVDRLQLVPDRGEHDLQHLLVGIDALAGHLRLAEGQDAQDAVRLFPPVIVAEEKPASLTWAFIPLATSWIESGLILALTTSGAFAGTTSGVVSVAR